MKNIVWAQETDARELELVGGKGANLGEMMRVGLPVPPAFFITAEAFKVFLDEAGLAPKLARTLERLDVDSNKALNEASRRAQDLVLKATMPKPLEHAIREAYGQLTGGEAANVAVRSSATAEDLPEASFAGQQDTYLHVVGPDDTVEHVRKCWASLFTPRAIYYRTKQHFPHEKVHMAVVVQRMVDSDVAGVMFTRHPTSGEPSIIVEAAWGLGEGVVSGKVTPDHYVLEKDGKLREETVASKGMMVVLAASGRGTREMDVPRDKRDRRVLTDGQLAQLARLGQTLEQHYNKAQDVEWAFEGDDLFVLQTRPITTITGADKTMTKGDGGEEKDAEVLLKGLGASPGTAGGAVVQVHSIEELDKCREGNVLVTAMTTPDMVPAMRRASSIVTDEGGMTCFPGDTPVLTDRGLVPIARIEAMLAEGPLRALAVDRATLQAEWRPILHAFMRQAPLVEVAVSQTGHGRAGTLRLTPTHKMLTFASTDLVERSMEDLLARGEAVTSVDRVPPRDEGEAWPVPPYLAGALFTDGHWRLPGRKGAVDFVQKATPEKSTFIRTVRRLYETTFGGHLGERTVTSTSTIRDHTFQSSALHLYDQRRAPAETLERLWTGLHARVLGSSEGELLDFVAGAADGDGTFNERIGTRLQIYCGDRHLSTALVLACLRLGIQPTLSPNRTCDNIQIVEGLDRILARTQRLRARTRPKELGTKLLAARQVLGERIDDANVGGRIRPYVDNNLLIDARKLERVLPRIGDAELRAALERVLASDLRLKRVRKVRDAGTADVFNIEVEGHHNYVVFTDNLTPVLVANCHAAIVGRELGIPCVVGTKRGTKVLTDGTGVTVHGDRGLVTKGITATRKKDEGQAQGQGAAPARVITATDVKVNISMPEATDRAAATGADGVGLLRIEHIILGLGEHPLRLIDGGREEEYVSYLVKNIGRVAHAFYPRPVWVRTLDAPTDEFRALPGGENEPKEANPMLGWRGIRRGLEQTQLLAAEFKAILRLREQGATNVGVMLPLVQHPTEIRRAKEIAKAAGLDPATKTFAFGIMIEIPAAALIIDDLLDEGLDFVSFGTNDLTQYTLAVDRNNEHVAPLFDEFHPAIGILIKNVITACNKRGVETSICGQAGSNPKFVEKLVEWGITSVSANIDAVERVRETVARAERRLLLKKVRDAA